MFVKSYDDIQKVHDFFIYFLEYGKNHLKELSPYKYLSVNAVLNFADKLLMALCHRTIVLRSLAVETKDFLILALSYGISLV